MLHQSVALSKSAKPSRNYGMMSGLLPPQIVEWRRKTTRLLNITQPYKVVPPVINWLRGELGLLFLARPAGQSVLIPAGRPARRVYELRPAGRPAGLSLGFGRPAGRLDTVALA